MNRFETLQPEFKTGLKRSINGIEASAWEKNDVGINVVLGISDLGLPARFLAGFVPAFSLAELINEKKSVTPELRIFVPLHLSERANGISIPQGEETIKHGALFIQKFQEIFHPSVSWFLDIDNPMTQQAISLLINLSDQLLSEQNPDLKSTWEKLFSAAQKRGNEETAKLYAPHHLFGWHDAWDPQNFFPAPTKTVTMNCFSTSEEPFQSIRKAFMPIVTEHMPHLIVEGSHLDLFTDRCPGPHYMPRKIGKTHEPLLGDLLTLGFTKTKQELGALISEGFKTAFTDLLSVDKHIEQLRERNPSLPNIEEFISEVNHADH